MRPALFTPLASPLAQYWPQLTLPNAQHRRALQKEDKAEGGLPEVDIILKGLLAEKGVEGFLVYNDAGACNGAVACLRLGSPNPYDPLTNAHNAQTHTAHPHLHQASPSSGPTLASSSQARWPRPRPSRPPSSTTLRWRTT